jgi:hypothetical protein
MSSYCREIIEFYIFLVQRSWFRNASKPRWYCWNLERYIVYILVAQIKKNKILRINDSYLKTIKYSLLNLKCFKK